MPAATKKKPSAKKRPGSKNKAPAPRRAPAPRWRNTPSMYGVHPGVSMIQDWIATLKEKTGRSLDEWLRFIKASGPAGEKARQQWLKAKHSVGTNVAAWLAERAEGRSDTWDDNPDRYRKQAVRFVEEMYSGPKAGLRPIHMALLDLAHSLGKDVRACPCKTIVPLYRNHVFAQIKPRTRSAVDLGLALGDTRATGRLIDTGGYAKKDRITHRIEITSPDQVDTEVRRWLKAAYDRDATKKK